MNEQENTDVKGIYRPLAAVVTIACLALLVGAIFSSECTFLYWSIGIFIVLGLPMARVASTGHFWILRKK